MSLVLMDPATRRVVKIANAIFFRQGDPVNSYLYRGVGPTGVCYGIIQVGRGSEIDLDLRDLTFHAEPLLKEGL